MPTEIAAKVIAVLPPSQKRLDLRRQREVRIAIRPRQSAGGREEQRSPLRR